MKVNQVMNKKVITCNPEEKVSAILNKLKFFNISGMPVVLKGKLVGLISRTDITNYLSVDIEAEEIDKKKLLERYKTPAKEIMTKEVITVDPSFTVEEAANEMVEHDINMLPVIHDDKVDGILTRGDIVKALAEHM